MNKGKNILHTMTVSAERLLKAAYFSGAAALLMLQASCGDGDTIHFFPKNGGVNPYMIEVTVSLDIDMAFHSDTLLQTYSEMVAMSGDYDVRYIVDIYPDPGNSSVLKNRVARIVKTSDVVVTEGMYHIEDTITLPLAKYKLIAWLDYVERGTTTDKYFNTEDLQNVQIIKQDGKYTGYNVTKDAFTSKEDLDLTPYRGERFVHHHAMLTMKRPFAVYQIRTDDIQEYITYYHTHSYTDIRPDQTTLAYKMFFPLGYNCYLNVPLNYTAGVGYGYEIEEIIPEHEAIVASDFVFVEDDTSYAVDFEMFDADGKHINTCLDVRINLKRNYLTILRSQFLTRDLNDSSIGINDRFDEELIIYYN
jgi:hypothetical protein